jgi:DNA-binding XRE family transcriptional regulator
MPLSPEQESKALSFARAATLSEIRSHLEAARAEKGVTSSVAFYEYALSLKQLQRPELPGRSWNLSPRNDSPLVDEFRRLSTQAVVALGMTAADPADAVDVWINVLRSEQTDGQSSGCFVRKLFTKSAHYFSELKNHAHLARDLGRERKYAGLARDFGVARPAGERDIDAVFRQEGAPGPTEKAPKQPVRPNKKRGRRPGTRANGDRFKSLRALTKLTQAELADKCGVSEDTIQRAEDDHLLCKSTIIFIAETFTTLLGRTVNPKDLSASSKPQ